MTPLARTQYGMTAALAAGALIGWLSNDAMEALPASYDPPSEPLVVPPTDPRLLPTGDGTGTSGCIEAQNGGLGCNPEVPAVPLPPAAWMLGAGLVALVVVRRRKG